MTIRMYEKLTDKQLLKTTKDNYSCSMQSELRKRFKENLKELENVYAALRRIGD